MAASRLKRLTSAAVIILAAGLCYGVFVSVTGFGIPCIFRAVTDLQCPGCGITHMCLSLLRLDFSGAFHAHPVIFSLLPVWLFILVKNSIQYVRTGCYQLSQMENILLYASIILLLVYGVLRNL